MPVADAESVQQLPCKSSNRRNRPQRGIGTWGCLSVFALSFSRTQPHFSPQNWPVYQLCSSIPGHVGVEARSFLSEIDSSKYSIIVETTLLIDKAFQQLVSRKINSKFELQTK